MAGVGLGPSDFNLFAIDDPEERGAALEQSLLPKLVTLGTGCLPGLARVAGQDLHLHAARIPRRRESPPEEAMVAFSESPRGYRGLPFLGVAVTREHLHARVGVRGDSPRREAMRRALEREAPNLARKGKPFRRLRQFLEWNHEELPELAPAASSAFWLELAENLAPGRPGLDVGICWTSDEARSVALGDLLGVFRDLAPVYKILAHAG
jgi:uncharacterized protein YktB (UPF0637 family)